MAAELLFIASRPERRRRGFKFLSASHLWARPLALARFYVNEINQRSPRTQLHHPVFGELGLDSTAENFAVKRQGW